MRQPRLWALGVALALWQLGASAQAAPALQRNGLAIGRAQQRVAEFLKTVPNLPNVEIVPGTGEIPWPESNQEDTLHAEVWTVVPAGKKGGHPIMMFAVRPDTGEVYVLYLRSLQASPKY